MTRQVDEPCPKCGSYYRRDEHCNRCGEHAPVTERPAQTYKQHSVKRYWDSKQHRYLKAGEVVTR